MTEDLTTRDITDAKVSTAISYNDGMLALAETPKELYSEHAVRLGTIVLTLCTQGTCTLKINGEPYTIGCNDLLVCVPNTVIEHVDLSPDVESRSIVLARTYAERLTMMAGNNWDMHLFVPVNAVMPPLPANSKLTISRYNTTPVEGFASIENLLYRSATGMPRPRNVLIPSIMAAIGMGYKHIYLAGADHSWTRTLSVDDNNNVVSIQPHFYKEDDREVQRSRTEYMHYPLHTIMYSFYVAFKSYFTIASYASHCGIEVINITPGSFIDAFPRQKV